MKALERCSGRQHHNRVGSTVARAGAGGIAKRSGRWYGGRAATASAARMGCTKRTRLDVVGRRLDHLVLGVIEDVGGHELALGVTVLPGLRGRHLDDLAGIWPMRGIKYM